MLSYVKETLFALCTTLRPDYKPVQHDNTSGLSNKSVIFLASSFVSSIKHFGHSSFWQNKQHLSAAQPSLLAMANNSTQTLFFNVSLTHKSIQNNIQLYRGKMKGLQTCKCDRIPVKLRRHWQDLTLYSHKLPWSSPHASKPRNTAQQIAINNNNTTSLLVTTQIKYQQSNHSTFKNTNDYNLLEHKYELNNNNEKEN